MFMVEQDEGGSYRSVAHVVDAESLQKVRAFRKEQKAAAAQT
jgi:peptide methionine sulfoxide reductase MsrA